MLLYRIAEEQFARDLSGDGARLYGGRWNPKGVPMLYTAESVALAALEVLVRLSTPKRYSRIVYEAPDEASLEIMTVQSLPAHWLLPYPNASLMEIGGRWARERHSLLLKVPSAAVRGEGWNILINPLHSEFSTVSIVDVTPFTYDERLLGR
ncbi:RES family NAD+ phosphorylase [Geobacter sp.]|uniref:RES family NAD+ phosphorylase n=1 Tax=Geobacter sp. TaxID=46610 RepID=UPI0027B902EE|nr:RES family NAD+ phosphorylase [Geobacter sp.]